MATVRPRARRDGTVGYQVIYYVNGVQRFQTHDTLKSATRAADLIDRIGPTAALEIIESRDGRDDDTAPTLSSWCTTHIEALTNVSEGTRHRYRRIVSNDLGDLSDLPIDAITEEAVARWVIKMKHGGASAKTIGNKQALVSAALARAAKKGLVPANVARGVRVPADDTDGMTFLTQSEFARFIGYIRPPERDLVTTLVGTGLRWGEATALQVRDWNPEAHQLRILRAWKEGPTGVVLGPPKSKKSRRTIDVPPELWPIIEHHIKDREPEDFIFTSPRGVPWRGSGHFHEFVWQPAVAAANGEVYRSARIRSRSKGFDPLKGKPWLTPAAKTDRLGKRPRVHDCRHTAASWMIQAGVPLPVVQEHLGHETIKTTVDKYGHLTPESRLLAATALSAGLSLALPQIEA